MPHYTYIARSRNGERVEGTVEASDRMAAQREIERQGQVPMSVQEVSSAASGKAKKKPRLSMPSFHRSGRKIRMNTREVMFLSRELSDLLASGMTLGNALNTLSGRNSGGAQDQIVAGLRDDIIQGSSLSEALSKRPETFGNLYVSLVRAGEASGSLPESLESICRHYERVQEAREKVIVALTYPAIVLIFGTLTVVFSMVFVIPKFTMIFEELNNTLPLPTRILIGISDGFIKYGWIVLLGLLIGMPLLRKHIRTEKGQKSWHRLQLRVPVIRGIISTNAFAQFARTLSALLNNGVPVLQALSIVEYTVGNVIIAKEISDARERVTDGSSISGPLAEGRVFPRLLTDMLAVGEETGDMSGALKHIARRYENELDRNVKVMTTVLEPVMILIIALMVGFVAISMLLAVFELTSGLGGG